MVLLPIECYLRTCVHRISRTYFRQILSIAALKKLTIRQYAFAFSPCTRQKYARKSAPFPYEYKFLNSKREPKLSFLTRPISRVLSCAAIYLRLPSPISSSRHYSVSPEQRLRYAVPIDVASGRVYIAVQSPAHW